MSQNCEINLDRPSGVYFSGETVNGHIYVTLPERALIKAIALEANGYASTAWLKPQKQKSKKSKKKPQVAKPPIPFGQRVDYFAKVDYFVGSEMAQPQLMESGTYRFDFNVQLPENCPSSFEGAHGLICHMLQLMLYRSSDQSPEIAATRELQVLQRNEVAHQLDQLTAPCEALSREQTPAVKFWQKPLELHVDVPQTGYEPGSGISVHVKMHNGQELPLKTVVYKLNQVSSYFGHQEGKPKRIEAKVERRCLVSSSHELSYVPRQELLHFQHLHTLQVPQVTPSLAAASCSCIQLSYEVEVVVQSVRHRRFIMAQIPIIVAKAPPMQACIKEMPMGQSHFDIQAACVGSAPAETPEPSTSGLGAPNFSVSMHSLASTNFREAEFMTATNLNKKDKHAMSGERLDFKPRYLYYEMEHTQAEKVL